MKTDYQRPSVFSKDLSSDKQVAMTGYVLGQTLEDMTTQGTKQFCGVVAVFDKNLQGAVFCMSGTEDISQELVKYKLQVVGDDITYAMDVCLKDPQGVEAGLQITECDGSLYFCSIVGAAPQPPQCIAALADSNRNAVTECSVAGCSIQ